MTDVFGLAGLLLLGLAGGGKGGRAAPAPASRSSAPSVPPAAPPWPQQLPPGLPAFPGAGWEYDEPPPLPVQQRAAQLVSSLWKQGKGSHRTEQTAGRWITYRAEIVKSGKQGVVAYRQKGASTLQRPPPALEQGVPESRAPSSPSSPWTLATILTSTSPGWPQPTQAGGFVEVKPGRWYQWTGRVDVPLDAIGDPKVFAENIARGLASAGAVNIAVSDTPPFIVAYQLLAKHAVRVPLGVAIGFDIGGVKGSITFLSGKEIKPPTAPKVPLPVKPKPTQPPQQPKLPPDIIARTSIEPAAGPLTTPVSPIQMRDLKVGSKGDDVALVQRKLGVTADGIFGKNTQTAVINFQRNNGLAPNLPTETLRGRGFGAVKQATWVALFGTQT